MIKFVEEGHQYVSLSEEHANITWVSVTKLISKLHEQFNAGGVDRAFECSIKKPTKAYPNKWYGIPPSEIEAAWNSERDRSTKLGHWYHNKRESELLDCEEELDVYGCSIGQGGVKVAPEQILVEGIYPEHLMYLMSAGICGQSDYVAVRNGEVHIKDYKTSKEIKRRGFTNYKGTKMMFHPIEHLEDCEYIHYNIQLSLYMYMILRHNPNLEPGTLTIEHVKFEEGGKDKYGYPIYKEDGKGGWVVKEVEEIVMPYLKKEVVAILEWWKNNRENNDI